MESALIEHNAVAEAAVVSSPDTVRGGVSKTIFKKKTGWQILNVYSGNELCEKC